MSNFDFPSNPNNGDIYNAPTGTQYTYDASKGYWTSSNPVTPGFTGSRGFTGSQGIVGYVGSRGGLPFYEVITSNTVLSNDKMYLADTSAGPFSVTLPSSPVEGYNVELADSAGTWANNNLTVDRNGATIDGDANNLILDITNVRITLVYNNDTWRPYIEMGDFEGSLGYTGSVGFVGSIGYTGSTGGITANDSVTFSNKTIHGDENTLTVDGTEPVGYLDVPQTTERNISYTLQLSDNGKAVPLTSTASVIIPDATFSGNEVVVMANYSNTALSVNCAITESYISGTDTNVSNVTLAARSLATVFFANGTFCLLTGSVE